MNTPLATELATDGLPEIATKAQVAHWLQVSEQTVERMVKRGDLPCRRLGRLVRFPAAMVREAVIARDAISPVPRNFSNR